jgi:hypothetical protein
VTEVCSRYPELEALGGIAGRVTAAL